ncbi:MAG: hypothetical protein GY797_33470 [Deltaproteobacteria bacterium]|nr:hypothetical protein [Deltaproteobacteria bacterium]
MPAFHRFHDKTTDQVYDHYKSIIDRCVTVEDVRHIRKSIEHTAKLSFEHYSRLMTHITSTIERMKPSEAKPI